MLLCSLPLPLLTQPPPEDYVSAVTPGFIISKVNVGDSLDGEICM